MSRSHHQNKEEQINNRMNAVVRLPKDKLPDQRDTMIPMDEIQRKPTMDDVSIRLLAYQIYREKGGVALDNWLEAERTIKNNDTLVSGFLNEGNPNTQN